MEQLTAAEATANGIATLDEYWASPRSAKVRAVRGQQWRPLIDKTRLYLPSASRCVLGQVFGYYDTGCLALGITTVREAIRCGFVDAGIVGGGDSTYAAELDDAWRQALPRWVP